MGVVYRAHDFALDRRVSLKLLSSGRDPESRRERLVAEAQALARVSHPNVLAVHDVGTWEDEVYLALEHVEGETLRSWLDRAPRSPGEIRSMFLQAARGLQAIHEAGLIHRDIKPENLLVGRDGRLRVADLGLAVTAGSDTAPVRETLRPGTPGYMPLEQHRGEPLDPRADQFSLAVALFESLVGHRPYGSRGTSREDLQARLARGPRVEIPRTAAVPPRLRRALEQALSPDRADRRPTLAELIVALESPGVPARRAVGGSAAIAAAAALAVVVLSRPGDAAVASAEPATWALPAYEFQIEGVEPIDPVAPAASARAGAPLAPAVQEGSRPVLAGEGPRGAALPSRPAAVGGPEVLRIGLAPSPSGAAEEARRGADSKRLLELQALLESLYRALSERREPGASGPLLALSAPPAVPGTAAPAGPGTGAPVQVASASLAASGDVWTDPSAENIAAIERRLAQQIRQQRAPPEIAQTQFALAQAIWDSTDAAESQNRALDLARKSKATLDSVQDGDASVAELRQAVDHWISMRTGPIDKPRGGRAVRSDLRSPEIGIDALDYDP